MHREKISEKLELGNADLANRPISNFDHFSHLFFVLFAISSNWCLCSKLKMGLWAWERNDKKKAKWNGSKHNHSNSKFESPIENETVEWIKSEPEWNESVVSVACCQDIHWTCSKLSVSQETRTTNNIVKDCETRMENLSVFVFE